MKGIWDGLEHTSRCVMVNWPELTVSKGGICMVDGWIVVVILWRRMKQEVLPVMIWNAIPACTRY